MNLTELKKAVAESSGLSQADTEKALKSSFAVITEALKSCDSVIVPGFGSFSIGERAARTGRNPQTGKEIKIAASKAVKFKAGKSLRSCLAKVNETLSRV